MLYLARHSANASFSRFAFKCRTETSNVPMCVWVCYFYKLHVENCSLSHFPGKFSVHIFKYLSELCRIVLEPIELGLVIMEVLSNGLDQLQVSLMEVLGNQVITVRCFRQAVGGK